MRKAPFIFFILISLKAFSLHPDDHHDKSVKFVENKGQWASNVLYKTNTGTGALFLEKNCMTFVLRDEKAINSLVDFKMNANSKSLQQPVSHHVNYHAYKIHFKNSNKNSIITGLDPAPDYDNYYISNDPAKWASGVKKYYKVQYGEIFRNIDFSIYEQDLFLKYDFVVHPGGNVADIALEYEGVDGLNIQDGNLVIKTSISKVFEVRPYAYQYIDGQKKEVSCRFEVKNNSVKFILPADYDNDHDLIIDPVLIFASYSGSIADNWGYTATYDYDGFLYTGGNCFATGYPTTTGAYQVNFGGGICDIVLSKYDTTGTFLVFSTYLGGDSVEVPHSLVVNQHNELYVYGTTGSLNFPVTAGSYDTTFNGGASFTLTYVIDYLSGVDIVVSKFSQDGKNLLASTFLGGSDNDGLNYGSWLRYNYADEARGEIMVDDQSNVYVVSCTKSANFPVTSGSFQQSFGGGNQDGVIVKLNNNLSGLIWSSFIGGSGEDAVYSITLDDNQYVYVSGGTRSPDFPVTPGTWRTVYTGDSCDGFIAKVNPNGTAILDATYYGSNLYDQVYFVELDKDGNIYVLGQSAAGGNVFIDNVAWSNPNSGVFISKLNQTLTLRIWSTTVGDGTGVPNISPTAFLVDVCKNIYVAGWGGSLNPVGGTNGLPITPNAFQATTDNNDYYFLVLKPDASGILFGSFYGGSSSSEHVDGGTSRFDSKGIIYQSVCAGCGGYSDFPTTLNSVSTTNNSNNCNNAVLKIDFGLPFIIGDFIADYSSNIGCAPFLVNFIDKSKTTGSSPLNYYWDFDDGDTSTLANPSHLYTQSGVYYVSLVVSDTGACNLLDTVIKPIIVLSNVLDSLDSKKVCKGDFVQIGLPPVPSTQVTYNWNPSTGLSSTTISNPIASPQSTTTYTLLISNGVCADTLEQLVVVEDLQIDAGNDTIICKNPFMLVAKANLDSLTYQWSSSKYFTDTLNVNLQDSTALVNITGSKTYYVKAHSKYCTAIDSIKLDLYALKNISISFVQPSCPGDCDGSASITYTGPGGVPYTYLWSTGDTVSTITGLCAGGYNFTITDKNSGCENSMEVFLPDPPPLETNPSSAYVPCMPVCNGIANITATGGTPPYVFVWSDGQTTNQAINLCAGMYHATITDSKNCITTDSVEVVDSSQYITINTFVKDDTIYQGQVTQIVTTFLSGHYYLWSPPDDLSNPTIYNPDASPKKTTTYYVVVTDEYGCEYIDSVKIVVLDVFCEEPYIYVPNAFTPNNDHKNDILYVRTQYAEELYFAIFDRWGEKVFETRDINLGWDGTYRGRICEPGVYVYHLEIGCYNREQFKKKGNITIIR